MKAISILALSCVILTRVCFAGSTPTLQETMDWITSRINGITFVSTGGNRMMEKVTFSFRNCELTFAHSRDWEGQHYTEYLTDGSARLGLLGAATVERKTATSLGAYSTLVLQSQSPQVPAFSGRSVRRCTGCSTPPDPATALPNNFRLGITFNDPDLGERVAKAFQHAITLCGGGKAEPF
jgi:hypothetical protein